MPSARDLGVVADPAQQPVGDPRRAARARGDLGGAVGRGGYAEQPGRAVHDLVELVGVVELEVAGEAEPVAQRAGQQPGAGGGADQRERRDLERDRGRARSLADDHVDPEVLHREVEHLLGGPRHPVDLVDEEDVALVHPGQDRGQVAGVGERRPAGQPQRRAHLGGDDHRQRGLAEPGRPGEQHVVGRPARAAGRPRAPARAGRGRAAGRSPRRGCAAAAPPRSRARRPPPRRRSATRQRAPRRRRARRSSCGHALLRVWRAARSSAPTSGCSPAWSATASTARSASRAGQPRPVSPWWTWSRQASPRGAGRRSATCRPGRRAGRRARG